MNGNHVTRRRFWLNKLVYFRSILLKCELSCYYVLWYRFFPLSYDFSIGFLNFSDSVFLFFYFIAYNCTVQDDMTPNGMLLDLGGICKERKKKDTTNHLILLKGCGA